jgi:predicted nucleic acid-binding Zn ribbon protein
MAKKRKLKIPKSVLDLRLSMKKFGKKHSIKLKGKGLSKSDKKRNTKRLFNQYSESAINGLNKAVKILAETNKDSKKILKVKSGVDNIINNSKVMGRIAKIYRKNQDNYSNMIFLPNMIMNTLNYYSQDGLNEEEKAIADTLDKDKLIEFCEKILKKEIKRYRRLGVDVEVSYRLATVVPTTRLFKNNRNWYRRLIDSLYAISGEHDIDLDTIMKAVLKIDKKKGIPRKDFREGFFSEFIFRRTSNKNHSFNDNQKDLHNELIEKALEYLDNIKKGQCREILKNYIKRRKNAEANKNDSKRIIKFIDHANSNSPYVNLKAVIQDLIADNSTNELYLS